MQPEARTRKEMVRRVAERDGTEIMEAALNYVWILPIAWIMFKLQQLDKQESVSRKEVAVMIKERTDSLHDDMTELKQTMKVMSENIVAMGVTIARMDERSKRDHD